jgi:alpha-beta hydrolase superfamily lysophospholipase
VLANAAALRDSLTETLHALDPKNRDPATKRIVVLGHSMGGVLSHTLVTSSQDRVWASVFRVPPTRLRGDPEAIRELVHILYFRRNPRVVRAMRFPFIVLSASSIKGRRNEDRMESYRIGAVASLEPSLN